jgi:hypothetical protein
LQLSCFASHFKDKSILIFCRNSTLFRYYWCLYYIRKIKFYTHNNCASIAFNAAGVAINNNGRITTRHIGGGHKQSYRVIDFKRNKTDIPGIVERLEYDPLHGHHL